MIFKLHYFCLTSGACAIGILLGVFMETYSDATSLEIGALLMLMPFSGIIFRPIICSKADREQAHRKYLIMCLIGMIIGYSPFVIIPYLGIHHEHPRLCFYILVVVKTCGDIAVGGVSSIADALAINYANRIGTEFSVYRVWGTIGWMTCGILIGQLNEAPFLPKYVGGWLVLIGASMLNMFVIWLWPKEYFEMKPVDLKAVESSASGKEESAMMKSLLPKEVVVARMKAKLRSVFFGKQPETELEVTKGGEVGKSHETVEVTDEGTVTTKDVDSKPINKRTQLKILALLFRRDPRLIFYLIFFTMTGFGFASLSFFIINLSNICHEQGTCQFSELTGFVQVSMASIETVFFIYIKPIKKALGRVKLCIAATLLLSMKFLFYGTYYSSVSPYWVLLSETAQGLSFGINLTLMIEMAHLFSNEVVFILPELLSKNVIKDISPASEEKLRLSLSATMQALMSTASDGLGRGLGALVYGLLLERYTFQTLWLMLGIIYTIVTFIACMINLFDHIVKPNLGLDVRAKLNKPDLAQEEKVEAGQQ